MFAHWSRVRPRKLTSLWTPAGRYTIHARAGGEQARPAAPVVFVPGLGLSGRYMVPLAEQFADDFPVFAVDPPGTGRSTKPAKALSATEQADALEIVAGNAGSAAAAEYCLAPKDPKSGFSVSGRDGTA